MRALNSVTRALETSPQFPAAQALRAEILLELDMPARAQEAMLMATASAASDASDADYINGISSWCFGTATRLCHRLNGTRKEDLQTGRTGCCPCHAPSSVADAPRKRTDAGACHRGRSGNAAVAVRQARLFALQPDYTKANEALDRAEKLFRDRTNSEGLCEVFVARGTLQAAQDDFERAAATLGEARNMAETSPTSGSRSARACRWRSSTASAETSPRQNG